MSNQDNMVVVSLTQSKWRQIQSARDRTIPKKVANISIPLYRKKSDDPFLVVLLSEEEILACDATSSFEEIPQITVNTVCYGFTDNDRWQAWRVLNGDHIPERFFQHLVNIREATVEDKKMWKDSYVS